MSEITDFYRLASLTSDLGRHKELVLGFPADAEALGAVVRGLLIHNLAAKVRGRPLPAERMSHMQAAEGVPYLILDGKVVDTDRCRENVLGVLRPFLDAMPVLADPGYEGAGHGVHVPVKKPAGVKELDIDTRAWNALLRVFFGETSSTGGSAPSLRSPCMSGRPATSRLQGSSLLGKPRWPPGRRRPGAVPAGSAR